MNRCWLLAFILFSLTAAAQKRLPAYKVSQGPRMDGLLNDAVWQTAPLVREFIVNSPNAGEAASVPTEVKILYTNDAVYVGARLYDKPADIRRQLTSRDQHEMQDCDNFAVHFDTYLDSQNAFFFLVTPANVQSDARLSAGGSGTSFDFNWDAVWDSRITQDSISWTVEMKIPYLSLRFPKTPLQSWGLNFSRYIRRKNEQSNWNVVNPKLAGFVNQSGVWEGVADLVPPLRLSFLPYVSAGYQTVPTSTGRSNTVLRSGGMDVKWGVNESFTLDMTLIPDFGQVVSDNVVLNLSPFEQQFTENRPFFTEGTELFNRAGLFYSRRVGQRPQGYFAARSLAADSGYRIVRNPGITRLYNATKFSGRNRKNLGIGIFNAVAAPMYAELENAKGERIDFQTSPLTNYNIIVLDQALKNRSTVTFTNTHTWRAGIGARKANATALDISLFDKANKYNFKLRGRFSHVYGRETYNGFRTYTEFDKVSGKWQWGVFNVVESDQYDINDLGILLAPNEFTSGGFVRFTQFVADKRFNFRRYNFNVRQENLYKPFRYSTIQFNYSFFHLFKNFWDVSLEGNAQPFKGKDYFELREPGRPMDKVRWGYLGIYGSTDSRKKLYVSYGGGIGLTQFKGENYTNITGGVRYRFNPKFSLEVNGENEYDKGDAGFRYFDGNGEPIIGRRHVREMTAGLNGVYNFRARMNLTMRLRHYWSDVRYLSFYNVDPSGKWLPIGYVANKDQSFNAFNIDMFYTWDFLLGSRLIVAWKNALGSEVFLNREQYPRYTNNFLGVLNSPHSNEISVRLVYFLDYNSLRRRGRRNEESITQQTAYDRRNLFNTSGRLRQRRSGSEPLL